MRCYATVGDQTVTSSVATVLTITATAAVRPKIVHFWLGCSTDELDDMLLWGVQRTTAAGTSTALTPEELDSGDPAATATAGDNHTVEPTYTSAAYIFHVNVNTRGAYQWHAYPGREPTAPATAANGFGFHIIHASSTPDVRVTLHHGE